MEMVSFIFLYVTVVLISILPTHRMPTTLFKTAFTLNLCASMIAINIITKMCFSHLKAFTSNLVFFDLQENPMYVLVTRRISVSRLTIVGSGGLADASPTLLSHSCSALSHCIVISF